MYKDLLINCKKIFNRFNIKIINKMISFIIMLFLLRKELWLKTIGYVKYIKLIMEKIYKFIIINLLRIFFNKLIKNIANIKQ